ncbi:MAG: hypothetical protein HY066_11460 [Betaproteobacteria bacterium]|nr:hypothetical protein [Betaproteobacteria bacterium]
MYSQEGATITVKRTLDHKLTKATISPDDYRLYRELGEAVYRDCRSQILYQ